MNFEAKNNPFNVGLVAICSFIGVGFLTGAEIWFYFARFGTSMIVGIAVFAVFSVILVYFSLNQHKQQNKQLFWLKTLVLGVSELLIASAMVSGLLEVSKSLFQPIWLFVFLCACFLIWWLFLRGLKGVVIYNYFVAAFVMFIILYLFLFNNISLPKNLNNFSAKQACFSGWFGALYIFMNISELRPILSNCVKLKTKKQKLCFSCIISLVLIFLIFLLSVVLFCNQEIVQFSMPFLLLFKNNGGVVYCVFLVSLLLAMISTAISCLLGAENKFSKNKNDIFFVKNIVMISALILGQIPFVCFVRVVYPAIAVLNIVLFAAQLLAPLFRRAKK